jgi:hypothetical protein
MLVCVSAARMCEVMSSGPSIVCRYPSSSSGTSRSKKSRRSSVTSGSAFSCMTSEHEVCWMKTVNTPVEIFCLDSQSSTLCVTGYKPLPRVEMESVALEVGKFYSSVGGRHLSAGPGAPFAGSRAALADFVVNFRSKAFTIKIEVEVMNRMTSGKRHFEWQDLALPMVLLLTGLILMGGDWLGMLSLDRIQNLWPAAFILVGLAELEPFRRES